MYNLLVLFACPYSPISHLPCRGEIVKATAEKEGVVYGEVDLKFLGGVRDQIPVTKQRRHDVYSLVI